MMASSSSTPSDHEVPARPGLERGPQAPIRSAERILVVDDEDAIRQTFARYLRTRGFQVETAEHGEAAVAALGQERFALALVDIRMPGMNGIELARHIAAVDPDAAVLVVTGVNDAPTATDARHAGASDYLLKPVDLADLGSSVDRTLHRRELLIEQRRIERLLRDEVSQRTAELERDKEQLREMTVGIVQSLVTAMEAKDPYVRGHSVRVSALAAAIAAEMRLPPGTVEQIRLAARLQDVGRIGVRETVLNKPGTLEEDELEHIREHVAIGVEILRPLDHLGDVVSFVRDHHERWDGAGYPRGVAGPEITIGGRILAAADAYQAMTSPRAYRDPIAPARVLELMESLAGTLLDPDVYAALVRVVRKG